MPIIRAPGAARRNTAAKTEAAAAKAQRDAAKTRLPNVNQQREQITLLTNSVLNTLRGVVT
jgi:hypothetical protein